MSARVTTGRGLARLERFYCKGFGPFDRGYTLDLTTLAPADRVIAIHGKNGAGKTTTLELAIPGAMYRQGPSIGSLVSRATSRDAYMESSLVAGGRRWTLRHMVDATSGKSEAVVLDERGQPVLPDTKVKLFDQWAAENLPEPAIFYASGFRFQESRGFLGAKPAERKDILLRLKGPAMQAIEGHAVEARDELKAARGRVTTLDVRIRDELARLPDFSARNGYDAIRLQSAPQDAAAVAVEILGQERDWAVAAVTAGEKTVASARASLAEAEDRHRARVEVERQDSKRRAERDHLHVQLRAAREALALTEQKIANNRSVLDNAAAIRAAAARLPELFVEQSTKTTKHAKAQAAATRHRADHDAAARDEGQAKQRLERAQQMVERCEAAAKRVANLPALREQLERASSCYADTEAKLRDARARDRLGVGDRLDKTLGTLAVIAGGDGTGAPTAARQTIDEDAALVAEAKGLPQLLEQLEANLQLDGRARDAADRDVRTAEADEEPARLLEQWRTDAGAARLEVEQLQHRRHQAGAKMAVAAAARDRLGEQLEALGHERATLEPLAKRLGRIDEADGRIAELVPQVEAGRAAVLVLEASIAALPPDAELPPPVDLLVAQAAVNLAEQGLAAAHRNAATLAERVSMAVATRDRLAPLEAERTAAEVEVADWTLLASTLGKDGLQAMVIDSAIPELNATTNELLHAAFGPRWTIDVRTQSADAKGKRLLETLDVWAYDAENSREGLAETLSGGERTIVAEALSLALTAMACRQAGADRPTLIRDESAGQLDAEKARAWMSMMRRAADLIGAAHILFVNHNPETWDLADRAIEVRS